MGEFDKGKIVNNLLSISLHLFYIFLFIFMVLCLFQYYRSNLEENRMSKIDEKWHFLKCQNWEKRQNCHFSKLLRQNWHFSKLIRQNWYFSKWLRQNWHFSKNWQKVGVVALEARNRETIENFLFQLKKKKRQVAEQLWYDLNSTTKNMGLCIGFLEVQDVAGATEERVVGRRSRKLQLDGFGLPDP